MTDREETLDVRKKDRKINGKKKSDGISRGLYLGKGTTLQIHFSLRKNDI